MDVQVFRANASTYQKPEFFGVEQARLESIPGVTYIKSLTRIDQGRPFILITNTHTNMAQIAPQILQKTILMIHPNSGYDNFDPEFVRGAKFPIIIGNQIRAAAVSEYILSAILRECCQIPSHHHWALDRSWDRPLLSQQRVFLFGFGHIGKILYRVLSPLVKEIVVYDPFAKEEDGVRPERHWNNQLLDNTDILICAAGLNDSNRKFFDISKLRHLPPHCLIVNTARGELFDEEHLEQHAGKNPKMKIYLDVFAKEPFDPGHLHHLPNINKTSHIAGVSRNLNQLIVDFEYQVIKDFLLASAAGEVEKFTRDYQHSILANRLQNNLLI